MQGEAEKERAAVVAWLRETSSQISIDKESLMSAFLEPQKQIQMVCFNIEAKERWHLADAIERGDHLKKGE